jgi:hypothetical protein
MVGFVTFGHVPKEATMSDIMWSSLSLLIAIFTMMVAAEVGQRRRGRH